MMRKGSMWDERFSAGHYVYGVEPNDFLREHVARLPGGGRVLCLAEGEGRNAVFLAQRGFAVTAVDASAVGLAKGERLARERGVRVDWVCADLADYELGERCWDGIVSIFCHLPAPVRAALHRRVVASLRDRGVLLLEAYTPAQLGRGTGGPPDVSMMMTAAALQLELRGLHVEFLRELEREVVEGTLHTGAGAVVQLMASR